MKELFQNAIVAAVVSLAVVVGFSLVGGDQPGNLGAANTRFPNGLNVTGDGVYAVDGTTVIDASGNLDGTVTSGASGTFTSSGSTTLGILTTGTAGGCINTYATSSATAISVYFYYATGTVAGFNGIPVWKYGACAS